MILFIYFNVILKYLGLVRMTLKIYIFIHKEVFKNTIFLLFLGTYFNSGYSI